MLPCFSRSLISFVVIHLYFPFHLPRRRSGHAPPESSGDVWAPVVRVPKPGRPRGDEARRGRRRPPCPEHGNGGRGGVVVVRRAWQRKVKPAAAIVATALRISHCSKRRRCVGRQRPASHGRGSSVAAVSRCSRAGSRVWESELGRGVGVPTSAARWRRRRLQRLPPRLRANAAGDWVGALVHGEPELFGLWVVCWSSCFVLHAYSLKNINPVFVSSCPVYFWQAVKTPANFCAVSGLSRKPASVFDWRDEASRLYSYSKIDLKLSQTLMLWTRSHFLDQPWTLKGLGHHI